MDILRTSIDWARAEMLSSGFFILFGAGFLGAGAGFWQMGRTDMARAYVLPALVAGALLLVIGIGIFVSSQARVTSFAAAHAADAPAFIVSEIERADKVLAQYRIAVFRVIPLIVLACSALVVLLQGHAWRAGLITTIAMMAVIMVIDTNANARLEVYKNRLLAAKTAE